MSKINEAKWQVFEEQGKYGYRGPAKKVMLEPRWDYAEAFEEGLAVVAIGNPRQYGYIRPDGSYALEPQFDNAKAFAEGKAWVFFKPANDWQHNWFLINLDGSLAINRAFYDASPFVDGLALVRYKVMELEVDDNGDDHFIYRIYEGRIDRQGNEVGLHKPS